MPSINRAAAGQVDTLVPSAARTAAGNTGALGAGWGAVSTIRAQLNVTAASGTTPSLTVLLEDSLDGTTWNTIGTFSAKTAAGREVINVTAPFTDTVRVSWTVTGTTPSFTFEVLAYSE